MDQNIDTIKEQILQQIKPINFGDELNIADILGEELVDYSTEPVASTLNEPFVPETIPKEASTKPSKSNNPILCHICLKILANRQCFKKHFAKHTGRFKCSKCKKVFARKENLQRHIPKCGIIRKKPKEPKPKPKKDEDAEINKYFCDKCSKRFTRRENYNQHVKIHDGIQVVCKLCQKTLSSLKSFKRHKKLHENRREKISCQDCPSNFTLKANLQRHIKYQQHKSTLICDKCQMSVKTELILQKHRSQDTTNTCKLCSQSYCLESDLRNHKKNVHSNLWFKCKECENTPFMTKGIKHLQEHAKKLHSVHLEYNDCLEGGWFIEFPTGLLNR